MILEDETPEEAESETNFPEDDLEIEKICHWCGQDFIGEECPNCEV